MSAPRIVLDAMGGDNAPGAPVAGAIAAIQDLGAQLTLVGPEQVVRDELARHRLSAAQQPHIVNASEVIEMADHPVTSVRRKRDSSIVVGLNLVASGEADAFVTMGNTGAAMAAAVLGLKRLPGVERPALATVLPTATGGCLLLDIGANADARADHLVQFGIMGAAYAEIVFGIREPRVALLSIGEEETKGSLLVQEAHQLLRRAPIHFIGNIEGKDIPSGSADVVVTDGFVGNVLVKFAEGIGTQILRIIREEIRATPWSSLLALGLRPSFGRVRRRIDYAEWGGAPLLGVNGVCIIGHGRSNAHAVRNGIRVAQQAVEQNLIAHIAAGVLRSPATDDTRPDQTGPATAAPTGDDPRGEA